MNNSPLAFTLALHRELPAEGNLVWSPYSVASALGLAAEGARSTTYDEMAAALAPGGNLADLGRTLADSARLEKAEIAVANSLWMQQDLAFGAGYKQAVLGWPGGALHTADFRRDPEGSRSKINVDVDRTTRGLIQDLLAPGSIFPEVRAVIVNALYLKVAWLHPFEQGATAPARFRPPSGTRQVETMYQSERMGYAAADGWRMATLRTSSDVVVDVLLPDEDLATAEATLTPRLLKALYDSATREKLDLALPRFRVEGDAILNASLQALGIVTAFTRDADFTAITTEDQIWIDQVVHKAVLQIDEEGLEGAAATAVVMRALSVDISEAIPFVVDRPFLMIVRHETTGAIYFVARITEP